jgi:hypothetical protein
LLCCTARRPAGILQVGVSEIVGRVVEDLKDEAEPYRRMVMETIDKVVTALGAADIDARLEELLVDGILYAFQEQVRRWRWLPAAGKGEGGRRKGRDVAPGRNADAC